MKEQKTKNSLRKRNMNNAENIFFPNMENTVLKEKSKQQKLSALKKYFTFMIQKQKI